MSLIFVGTAFYLSDRQQNLDFQKGPKPKEGATWLIFPVLWRLLLFTMFPACPFCMSPVVFDRGEFLQLEFLCLAEEVQRPSPPIPFAGGFGFRSPDNIPETLSECILPESIPTDPDPRV